MYFLLEVVWRPGFDVPHMTDSWICTNFTTVNCTTHEYVDDSKRYPSTFRIREPNHRRKLSPICWYTDVNPYPWNTNPTRYCGHYSCMEGVISAEMSHWTGMALGGATLDGPSGQTPTHLGLRPYQILGIGIWYTESALNRAHPHIGGWTSRLWLKPAPRDHFWQSVKLQFLSFLMLERPVLSTPNLGKFKKTPNWVGH